MFSIPSYFVTFSALIVILAILYQKGKVDIRLFIIPMASQAFVYLYYFFFETTPAFRQFVTRSNAITVNLSLALILFIVQWRKEHGE